MTNDNDPYLLFTQCHRLYVQGVRRALRERLEKEYGGNWWSEGVMGALSDERRDVVARLMERDPERRLESHLDSAHFAGIVGVRPAAFSDAFDDTSAAFNQLRHVARMRNEWAHVQDMPSARVIFAIETMRSVLASLRQSEALDVNKLSRNLAGESRDMAANESMEERFDDGADAPDDDYELDDVALPTSALWKQLRSCLSVNTSVVVGEDDNAIITVEVYNTAVTGEGLPPVWFNSVQIHANNVSERRRNRYANELGPGQSFSAQYTCPRNALATASFSVSGNLNMESFFHFSNPGVLPREIVSPILDEFFERFEALDIKAPFERALDTISGVNPSMTIADLLSVRPELERIKSLVNDKANGMGALFKDFHLNGEHPLGKECYEIAGYFGQVTRQIETVENAIGSIDLDTIAQVARNLEQIQLAVLRIEDAVKNMRAKPRAPSSP